MFKRGRSRNDAWEGVVTSKKRSSPDGQNMYHRIAVTLSDGSSKEVRVRRALWRTLNPETGSHVSRTLAPAEAPASSSRHPLHGGQDRRRCDIAVSLAFAGHTPLLSLTMDIDKQGNPAGDGADAPSRITFRLDPASGVPTYLQLVHQVEQALRVGYLAQGDQLPRVKDVVGTLAINPNTVLKAYRELEHRGIAAGRQGQGTFVQAEPGTVPLSELNGLRKSLLTWLRAADSAGLDSDGMTALFSAALRDFHERRAATGAPRGEVGRTA